MTTAQTTTVVLIGGPRCGEVHPVRLDQVDERRLRFVDPSAVRRDGWFATDPTARQVPRPPIVEYELVEELHPTMHYRTWSVTREGHLRAQIVKTQADA